MELDPFVDRDMFGETLDWCALINWHLVWMVDLNLQTWFGSIQSQPNTKRMKKKNKTISPFSLPHQLFIDNWKPEREF